MNERPPPTPPPPLPPKKRMGCVGQGCLAVAIIGVLGTVVFGVGGWFLYNNLVSRYTADQPANVQIDQPSSEAIQQARMKLEQLQSAVRDGTETTLRFSAADLNTLIATEPDFAGMRGKMRVDMTGSDMILDLSAPLANVRLPKVRGRWFNGRVRFRFIYELDQFAFEAKSLEVGGDRMDGGSGQGFAASFFRSFGESYTRNFNRSFREGQNRNPNGRAFWKQVKTMSVEDDQLVLVTKAGVQ